MSLTFQRPLFSGGRSLRIADDSELLNPCRVAEPLGECGGVDCKIELGEVRCHAVWAYCSNSSTASVHEAISELTGLFSRFVLLVRYAAVQLECAEPSRRTSAERWSRGTFLSW